MVPIRNRIKDLRAALSKKEKCWDVSRHTLEAKRVSFYKFILTPRAHTHWAAGAFRDEFQLMLSTQQRWARLGAASDFPTGTRAHTAQGGGPLCPMLGVRGKTEKEAYCQNIAFI